MKRMALIALAVSLVASTGGNVYLSSKLAHFADRRERDLMKYYEDWKPTYPVDGLTIADLSVISAAIDRQESVPQDRRMLQIEMMDRDHVLIQTGIKKGGLWGRGKMFRFRRDNDRWEIETDKTSLWES